MKKIILGVALLATSLLAKSEWSFSAGPSYGTYINQLTKNTPKVEESEPGVNISIEYKSRYRNDLFVAYPITFNYLDTKNETKMYLFDGGPKLGYAISKEFDVYTSLYYTQYGLKNDVWGKGTGKGFSYGGGFDYKVTKHAGIGFEYTRGETTYDTSYLDNISLDWNKYSLYFRHIF